LLDLAEIPYPELIADLGTVDQGELNRKLLGTLSILSASKSATRRTETCGPPRNNGSVSSRLSIVCFIRRTGCRMLDLPLLFAPARIVRGLIAIDWRVSIDLNPETVI